MFGSRTVIGERTQSRVTTTVAGAPTGTEAEAGSTPIGGIVGVAVAAGADVSVDVGVADIAGEGDGERSRRCVGLRCDGADSGHAGKEQYERLALTAICASAWLTAEASSVL